MTMAPSFSFGVNRLTGGERDERNQLLNVKASTRA